ncbi:hypothetical protein A3A67_02875 [Candidatus Peribacteria bacterium RIFCSPLOWO2_01_FULL_51_18]|nr:MAG: hypothetical protein A3A67_02875 [Candidatus Peribacteria bacterium RIFCSPLOWO2_01_FULL_51_18]OGJ68437.1 MAG: hypothetical protein A3J34_04585 [Candidatus Peribacteria bacterium RIFCSPLOWO2_02_FULL_51_10]
MSQNPIAIEADHVSFRFGPRTVLDNVSAAVPEGEYVGIVGPNGGGKTTLLRIILGLIVPTAGKILVFGKDPKIARRGGTIGYVSQKMSEKGFVFPATVGEIVRSGRTPRIGIGKRFSGIDISACDWALELVGASDMKSRIFGSLSGGEQQKVLIAKALAREPRILILDEPTTGVDTLSQEQFFGLLRKLNKELNLTILFVTHDVETITRQAGFILELNQKILCHCAAHEFLSEETLNRLYGGEAEMRHHHMHK